MDRLTLSLLGLIALGCLTPLDAQSRKLVVSGKSQVGFKRPKQVPPTISVFPGALDFAVEEGQSAQRVLRVRNEGGTALFIDQVEIQVLAPGQADGFALEFDGQTLLGGVEDVSYSVARVLQPGEKLSVPVTFSPFSHDLYSAVVQFSGVNFEPAGAVLSGLASTQGHPFLHVVIEPVAEAVDYDDDGTALVRLDGTLSHTHEFGQNLLGFEWRDGPTLIGTSPVLTVPLAVGSHDISLTILDDNVPAESLSDNATALVHAIDQVPGVLINYYDASVVPPATLISELPATPDFAEVRPQYVVLNDGTVGGSPFTGNVVVQMIADVLVDADATYVVLPSGGQEKLLWIDGAPVSAPVFLTAGRHTMEVRFAVPSLLDLAVRLSIGLQGSGAPTPIPAAAISHDESDLAPIINQMPDLGTVLGGNQIVIEGLGFFPPADVELHWGGATYTEGDFDSLTATQITFTTPPELPGPVAVSVETPNGSSNGKSFLYLADGPVPINFAQINSIGVQNPTTADWGPDGRFYVARRTGQIMAIEFDADYNAVSVQTYTGLAGLSNNEVTGLAFNPFDDPAEPVRIYLAHGELFAQGGSSFTGPAPYDGEVSILEGPNFDLTSRTSLVSGLPQSNHDHSVYGLQFDNNGDLYIAMGGNTNAGVRHPNIGDIPASPLSGAILKAELSHPNFNGALSYVNSLTGLPDANTADMVYGYEHDLAPGTHVTVHAPGLRNAYDIVFTTRRRLYATDNGPNNTFGYISTGPTTDTGTHAQDTDEINLVEYSRYYGHPNRNRGRTDPQQNVYYGTEGPAVPDGHTPALSTIKSSSNGLVEYRSNSFGGQMRGDLLAQQWGNYARRIQLGNNGRSVTKVSELIPTGALDVQVGPGGAILAVDYLGSQVKVFAPDDQSLQGLTVLDVFPWRAPATGGAAFVLGGSAFGDLLETTVTIGGIEAVLTSVSPTRIEGIVPAHPDPPVGLQDIVVTLDDGQNPPVVSTLSTAFRFLRPVGTEPGFYEFGGLAPESIGEVAMGEIGGLIFVIGEGTGSTLRYNTNTGAWPGTVAPRPFQGHHHSAEVHGDKLYVIGGLGGGSEGRVQIYDPALDLWTAGANMPWAGGSVNTALIDGKIYAAGGIVGSTTVDNCAVYDIALDSWTPLASMPIGEGRNHAAAGTDGERLWIFGGRGLGSGACNCVANGFDTVHVYDPVTDTWESSLDPGSTLAEMPIGRGGTGRAVFHQGEFYVMGGETIDGPGAEPGNVYARVDVYDPELNTWRREADLPTPRHGIYPIEFQGLIFVLGGGTNAGNSQSKVAEILNHQ